MTRRDLYAAIGAALSLGAPLGLVVVRAMQAREPSPAWLGHELGGERWTYAYVCLSTLVAFTLFGFVLGKLADRLLVLSTTDPLTGLHNRRALFQRLKQESARSARHREPLSLLIIDVDGLKALNDRHGHRVGDAALSLVGSAVRTGSRAIDTPARWGGDEFALLAPNTGPEAAARLAERVRALVVAGSLGADGDVTVSVGISTLEPESGSFEAEPLIRAADAALYEAKRAGRNRVVSRPSTERPAQHPRLDS